MQKLISLIILVLIGSPLFLNAADGQLPTRDEIADTYKWKLEDIYPDKAAWQKDYTYVQNEIPKFEAWKGKLGTSSDNMLKFFEFSNEVEKKFSRVFFYAMSSRDLDLNNGESQSMYDKSMKLYSDFSAALAWVTPEILLIPESKIKEFTTSNKELAEYKHMLQRTIRMKKYTLDERMEKMLAELSPIGSSLTQAYGILNDAELPFPEIEGEDGKMTKVSHGRYRAGLYSSNREYRERVYKGTYVPYNNLQNTFASLFNGRVKTRTINAKVSNYNSALESALYGNNIPVSVYDNLISTIHDNFGALHRWAEIKKRVLGVDELRPYDTYVTLFPNVEQEYTYDEAKQIALEALKPLGDEYQKVLRQCFDERWIDVYETKGKRSGAYSNGCSCGSHPIILLNWNNTMDDLFTLVHELGHNMHSYFTEKYQPYQYANYSIFVAEVASITNEALLLDYLIQNAKGKEEKMALIEKFLMNAQTTFFRQTRFAEFEKIVHEKAEAGEMLNAEQLTKLFGDLYSQYWGPAMVTDPEEGLSWARIPHFFNYNFYVFQYSTGFAAAQALSEQMISEGKPAVDRYLQNFIYAGNSDYPINVLKNAGVDMSTPDPIVATAKKINRYLDELEKLLNEG